MLKTFFQWKKNQITTSRTSRTSVCTSLYTIRKLSHAITTKMKCCVAVQGLKKFHQSIIIDCQGTDLVKDSEPVMKYSLY